MPLPEVIGSWVLAFVGAVSSRVVSFFYSWLWDPYPWNPMPIRGIQSISTLAPKTKKHKLPRLRWESNRGKKRKKSADVPAGPQLRSNVMTRINTTEEEEETAPCLHGICLSFSAPLAAVKDVNGCEV